MDVYSKSTKPTIPTSFTYVHPKTCYPFRNLNKIPEGIALRLRYICDSDEKFEKRSNECKNYLIARNYSPSLVAKLFQKVSQISRDNVQKYHSNVLRTDSVKFVTSYSPILPNINSLINNYLPILHADLDLKETFPRKSITTHFIEVNKPQRNVNTILLSQIC